MSAPRLVVCGLEPGPAVALAAGALLAAFADERAVRPVLLGVDLPALAAPLRRVVAGAAGPRPAADRRRRRRRAVRRLVGGRRSHDRRRRRAGARPLAGRQGLARRRRGRRARRPARARRRRSRAGRHRGRRGLRRARCWPRNAGVRRRDRGRRRRPGPGGRAAPHPARRPPGCRCSAGCRRSSASSSRASTPAARASLRQIGPQPVKGGEAALCREAGGYLDRDGLEAAAARRGFLPARPRRLLAPLPAAAGLTLAVAWGPPLEPFALEAIDLLQGDGPHARAAPHRPRPRRCRRAPRACSSPACSTRSSCRRSPPTTALKTSLAAAIGDGLPTLALGGGALLLLRRLADSRGRTHELAGVLPAEAELLEWYERPRYVRAARRAREPLRRRARHLLYELFDLEFLTLQQEAFA